MTGNGNYTLSNFQKPTTQINGTALFTFFNSGLSTGNRDVVPYDGNDSKVASKYDFRLDGISRSRTSITKVAAHS